MQQYMQPQMQPEEEDNTKHNIAIGLFVFTLAVIVLYFFY